jgi:hypothetical protein
VKFGTRVTRAELEIIRARMAPGQTDSDYLRQVLEIAHGKNRPSTLRKGLPRENRENKEKRLILVGATYYLGKVQALMDGFPGDTSSMTSPELTSALFDLALATDALAESLYRRTRT